LHAFQQRFDSIFGWYLGIDRGDSWGMKPSALPQRALTSAWSILFMVLSSLAAGCDGTFDEGGDDPPADDGADPAPGCDRKVVMSMNITGKVLDPRGRPHVGHVVLRDRSINVGAIYGEAGANEAGFFLLITDGVITSAGCKLSYVIEVDSRTAEGENLYGELDVTSLFPAGGTGETDEDITDTPVVLAVLEP